MSSASGPSGGSYNSATELMRELLKASEDYSKALGRQLEINQTDLKVMEHLIENGPQSPTQLANAVGITTGALTQSLDRLEALNHTSRERSSSDRRSVAVVANPESIKKAWQGIKPLIEKSEELLSKMSREERVGVEKFLTGMIDAYKTKQD